MEKQVILMVDFVGCDASLRGFQSHWCPLGTHISLGKLLNISVLNFAYKNVDDCYNYLIELLWKLWILTSKEFMQIQLFFFFFH